MEQAEMQAILSHVFNRLQRLEADMTALQEKEKDLRTVMTEGFARIDKSLLSLETRLEDQIDTLAIQTNLRFEQAERRMDKVEVKIDILDVRTQDMSLKLNKILDHLAIA